MKRTRSVGFGEQIYQQWSTVRGLFRGLKIAWVSVASVVLALLMFGTASQVQDLFLEVKDNPLSSVGYWLMFYFVVIVAWGLPVYISSRWILWRFAQGPGNELRPSFEPVQVWVRQFLPPLLTVACFGAVLLGQIMAIGNAPTVVPVSSPVPVHQGIPNLAGLEFLGKRLDAARAACKEQGGETYCVLLGFVSELSRSVAHLVSDTLGSENVILMIYAVLLGVLGWFLLRRWLCSWSVAAARIGGKVIWWLVTAILAMPLLLALLVFKDFTVEEGSRDFGLTHLTLLPGLTLVAAYLAWRGLRPNPVGTASPIGRVLLRFGGAKGDLGEEAAARWVVSPLFYGVAIVSVVVIALLFAVHPVKVAEHVYRAPMLPFLLGAMVAPVTYLSYWSVRARAPLVLVLILLISGATLLVGGTNDIRTVATIEKAPARNRLSTEIERWAEVNNCSVVTRELARACPSPIIIAAAGGASRSAFHVAGVIGKLLDGSTSSVQKGHKPDAKQTTLRAAFSPDGRRILTTSAGDRRARIWDAEKGAEIAPLKGHRARLHGAWFSPDGRLIVTASGDSTARLWNAESGRQVALLNGHLASVQTASFSADGRRVVTASVDNTALVWNIESGRDWALMLPHTDSVLGASFSPDGRRIVTTSSDKTARVWDAEEGKQIALIKDLNDRVPIASFSPDGRRIVTASSDGSARVWDAESGQQIALLKGHQGQLRSAAFSPDGRRIVTASLDRTARVWDAESGRQIALLRAHERAVNSASFSPDGRSIATASDDNTARVWNAESEREVAVLKAHASRVLGASFSPDGRQIVTASSDLTARVWDAETGAPRAVLNYHAEEWRLQPFGKQLFAISAVSGGTLGAVVAYAAMADSQSRERATNGLRQPPCREGIADADWFTPAASKPHESWRSCLQKLVAGDFLSPVMAALATSDLIHVRGGRGDRAAVLEQAWESRYARLTGQSEQTPTLGEAMLSVRRRVLASDRGNWLPLLLLNGTSVSTGRRIVTVDFTPYTRAVGAEGAVDPVFEDTYVLHDLFAGVKAQSSHHKTLTELIGAKSGESCRNCDIRLSTGATMSARFPVISPHGNIRGKDGKIIDRVVDGGYFENFGASTALELARVLDAHGLSPLIILINNEPTSTDRLENPTTPQATWFASVFSPLKALTGTREARGTHAAAELRNWIDDPDRFAFITVERDARNPHKALSMSWWLSKHVQKYLDDQLKPGASRENDSAFAKIEDARTLLERIDPSPRGMLK